jgi:hypothetical protein
VFRVQGLGFSALGFRASGFFSFRALGFKALELQGFRALGL